MKLRRIIATVTVAAMFFWAPSMIPLRVSPAPVRVALLSGCGVGNAWLTADTAFATPVFIPCPVPTTSTPWPVIVLGAGVVSVIVNSIIVSNTQCRELLAEEALTSLALPFFGIALNQHHNHCRQHH